MKLAFLGGTRFIGHAGAELAAARGHEVFVLHRGRHPSELVAAQPIAVDRADPSALCETLARLRPDALVDTRAMTWLDAEVTALAIRVLELPLVVLSSQDVYAQFGRLNGLSAPPPETRVNEGSPLTIPYPFRGVAPHEAGPDYDKKEVEQVLGKATTEGAPGVTILRLPPVYGRRDYKRRFGAIVDALDAGAALPCTGGAPFRMTHAHVADVAHAIVLAAEAPRQGVRVFNVGEAETPTMRERAEALAAVMGKALRWEETRGPLPAPFEVLGALPNDFVSDSSRIRNELGFQEITTEDERLSDTIAWLRASRRAALDSAGAPPR